MPKKLKTSNKKISSTKVKKSPSKVTVVNSSGNNHLPFPLMFLFVLIIISVVISLIYFQKQQYKYMKSYKNMSKEEMKDKSPKNTEKKDTSKEQGMKDKPSLAGTSWTWVKTTTASTNTITPLKSSSFVLKFNTDGSFSSTTDCNGLGGNYLVGSKSRIGLFDMVSTEMYCENSQEALYVTQLSNISSYVMSDKELQLVFSDNSSTMVFKKN